MNIIDNLIDIPVLNNRLLIEPKFSTNSDNADLDLNDIIFAYNNGKDWRMIPLRIAQKNPIIYDNYFELSEDTTQVQNISMITIYICPFTLLACVYFGEYISFNKVYNNNLVISNKANDKIIIPIIHSQFYLTGERVTENLRRSEVKLLTIKNAITKYPDCQFILENEIPKEPELVSSKYMSDFHIKYNVESYSKKFHPKTIIYVIEYISNQTHNYKYTILLPNDANESRPNDPDIFKNGLDLYLGKMMNKIIEKAGLIYPCFWFAWSASKPKTKLIKLT